MSSNPAGEANEHTLSVSTPAQRKPSCSWGTTVDIYSYVILEIVIANKWEDKSVTWFCLALTCKRLLFLVCRTLIVCNLRETNQRLQAYARWCVIQRNSGNTSVLPTTEDAITNLGYRRDILELLSLSGDVSNPDPWLLHQSVGLLKWRVRCLHCFRQLVARNVDEICVVGQVPPISKFLKDCPVCELNHNSGLPQVMRLAAARLCILCFYQCFQEHLTVAKQITNLKIYTLPHAVELDGQMITELRFEKPGHMFWEKQTDGRLFRHMAKHFKPPLILATRYPKPVWFWRQHVKSALQADQRYRLNHLDCDCMEVVD